MDVTTDNFTEARIFIEKEVLPKTRYIAFDLEFTGVRYEKFDRDHINYLPFEKYKKLKYVAENYQILQLGISFVTFEGNLKVYPFNFYLFPRKPTTQDINLNMQLGCVKFNAQNGMDWNKWINKGVNYVKLSEVEGMQEHGKGKPAQGMISFWNTEWKEVAEKFMRKMKDVNKDKEGTQFHFSVEKFPLIIKRLPSLFQQYARENNLSLSLTEEDESLIIKKVSTSQRQNQSQKILQETHGFTLLFEHIWKKKIPFVGHNCLLDLLYIYQNFVAPLPQSYFDFKTALIQSGNSFYDTKYIALNYPSLSERGSRLEDIVKEMRKSKKITQMSLEHPFDRYGLEKQILHEAGYDSFLTAWAYQQSMKLFDDLSEKCENRLNINFSFFYINLKQFEDEINPYFSDNMLRINIPLHDKEEIRGKRGEVVKAIKKGMEDCENMYVIHEGYREIFIEIKDNKKKVLQGLFSLMEKMKLEISSFVGFLAWQKERVSREYRDYKTYDKKMTNDGKERLNWKKK